MQTLQLDINPSVPDKFDQYPDEIRSKMVALRDLIISSAEELEQITKLEETLKWGEPSYITKIGSTIRIDWKEKKPDQYAIYFKCTSRLVPTFKVVFGDLFTYEGNRAIVFQLNEPIPTNELKKCIQAGLTYHKIKHLPLLGF